MKKYTEFSFKFADDTWIITDGDKTPYGYVITHMLQSEAKLTMQRN